MNVFLGETGTKALSHPDLVKKIRVFHGPTEPNTLPQKKREKSPPADRNI